MGLWFQHIITILLKYNVHCSQEFVFDCSYKLNYILDHSTLGFFLRRVLVDGEPFMADSSDDLETTIDTIKKKEKLITLYFMNYEVMKNVAVSRGYDTCFMVKACDGLYQLIKSMGLDWNTICVSVDRVDLCQTHCKQVPDFSRPSGCDQVTWAKWANSRRRCIIFGKAGN